MYMYVYTPAHTVSSSSSGAPRLSASHMSCKWVLLYLGACQGAEDPPPGVTTTATLLPGLGGEPAELWATHHHSRPGPGNIRNVYAGILSVLL